MKKKTMSLIAVAGVLCVSDAVAVAPVDLVLKSCKIQSKESYDYRANTYYLRSDVDSFGFYTFEVSGYSSGVNARFTLVDAGDTANGRNYFVIEAKSGKCLKPYQNPNGSWIVSAGTCENIKASKWTVIASNIYPGTYSLVSARTDLPELRWTIGSKSAESGRLKLNAYTDKKDQRYVFSCTDLSGSSDTPDP
jgi:hypothetical protein